MPRPIPVRSATLVAVACLAVHMSAVHLPAAEPVFAWQEPQATVSPAGDIEWAPRPFRFVAGPSVRHIDFEAGSDDGDGSRAKPWKHHPWDAAATGAAAACTGVHTYVFKGGVIYRGSLLAKDVGTAAEPIRLTRDPGWGSGPAVIAGSEVVTGLAAGRAHQDIPEVSAVLSADLAYAPRSVWLVSARDGSVVRVPLARTPNWTISNWDDIKSEWWSFDNPGSKHQDLELNGYNAGIDSVHLTESADHYKGAYIWAEWGYVMGTPFAAKVEAFDPKEKKIGFTSKWGGKKGEHIIRWNRYYLEDKPAFLDDPTGEFWFERKGDGGTLHLRLPAGTTPADWRVEAAHHPNLIDATRLDHVEISGLDFRFTNTRWELDANPHRLDNATGLWSAQRETDPAAIRLNGSGEGIVVRNCTFTHVNKAVRLRAEGDDDLITGIAITDNDISWVDDDALGLLEGSYWGTDYKTMIGQIGTADVLRNRLRYCGVRPTRYGHGHAINITYADLLHVAGNVLDRCWASGIFVFGGKNCTTDTLLSRILIHDNKVTNALLNSNDWGQIEHWHGGPAYLYNNVSGNPGGYWNYNFKGGWSKDHANARFGHAYYSDHGNKGYFFNNIAWGNSNDLKSPLTNCSAFQEIGNRQNSFFNNTAWNFLIATRRQSPKEGFGKYLGNIYADISLRVFNHSDPKGAPAEANAHHVGDVGKEFAYATNAYARNLMTPVPEVGVFELTGTRHTTLASFATAMEQAQALAAGVGEVVAGILPKAAEHDFHPSAAADGKGVKVFVPWGVHANVAEWNFYRERKTGTVLDEQWTGPRYGSDAYRFPLTPINIGESDFVSGELEDWCAGALKLNGRDQYLTIPDKAVSIRHQWTTKNPFKKEQTWTHVAEGDAFLSPSVRNRDLMIEVYFTADKPAGEAVLIEKTDGTAGYGLVLDAAGKAVIRVKGGGLEASLASTAVLADGKWHHLLVEVDRAQQRLAIYVDGKADGSGKGLGPVDIGNGADVFVGGTPAGRCLTGTLDMMRVSLGTLASSKTTIEELHAWQFAGPQTRDFSGRGPTGAGRDAGAVEGR